jgi:hypothetical protein
MKQDSFREKYLRLSRNGSRYFTLVELLITISVIAIIVSLLLPALNKARDKSRSIACYNNLKTVGTAIQFYMQDYDGWFRNGYGTYWRNLSPYVGGPDDSYWSPIVNTPAKFNMPEPQKRLPKQFLCPAIVPNIEGSIILPHYFYGVTYSESTSRGYAFRLDMPARYDESRRTPPSEVAIAADTTSIALINRTQNGTGLSATLRDEGYQQGQGYLYPRHFGNVNIIAMDCHVESWKGTAIYKQKKLARVGSKFSYLTPNVRIITTHFIWNRMMNINGTLTPIAQ